MKSYKLILSISLVTTCFSPLLCQADPAIEQGKAVYNGAGACMGCHGVNGAGDGPASGALNPKPADLGTGGYKYDTDGDGSVGTEVDVYDIITNGAAKYGGSPLMVGRPDISEADRKALTKYVLSLKK